jgi:hypothetical protein
VVTECARLLDAVEPGGAGDLAAALTSSTGTRRAVIISDCLDGLPSLMRSARTWVSEGRELFVVHVVAREELVPLDGAILATDPEHDDVRRALTPETREAYSRDFARWREDVAREWRRLGAEYELTATDEEVSRVVRRLTSAQRVEDVRA